MDNLQKGTRVQLHATTDHWMRGDRYGEIVGLGRARDYIGFNREITRVRPYRVKLDKSGRVVRVYPDYVFAV